MRTRTVEPRYSLEEFERLPDDPAGERRELVRGMLVREPAAGFEHGWIAATVCEMLGGFVRARRLGVVVGAETGFLLLDAPPVVRAPDVAFVTASRLPVGTTAIKGFASLAPDLAVEVVSPSTTRRGMREKVRDYLDAGTRLVWVLDPGDLTLRVCRADGSETSLRRGDDVDGEDVLPGFRAAMAEFFPGSGQG